MDEPEVIEGQSDCDTCDHITEYGSITPYVNRTIEIEDFPFDTAHGFGGRVINELEYTSTVEAFVEEQPGPDKIIVHGAEYVAFSVPEQSFTFYSPTSGSSKTMFQIAYRMTGSGDGWTNVNLEGRTEFSKIVVNSTGYIREVAASGKRGYSLDVRYEQPGAPRFAAGIDGPFDIRIFPVPESDWGDIEGQFDVTFTAKLYGD